MGTAFKQSNFICAASFSRRLLELPDMSSEKNAALRVKVRYFSNFDIALLCTQIMASHNRQDLSIPYASKQATKVLQKSEQNARNEHKLNYNESASFSIDCRDFIPIYGGDPSFKCSYCGSVYADESMKNKACYTCEFTLVGVQTIGLVTGS